MLCRNCGCYANDESIVCPKCGRLLQITPLTPEGGAEAIRQGKRAREALRVPPEKKAQEELRRKRRSGASHATIQMTRVSDTRGDPNDVFEPYAEQDNPAAEDAPESENEGIERRIRPVYSDHAAREEQIAAYMAAHPPRRMNHRMVNWVKVGLVLSLIVVTAGVSLWLFLSKTDQGQKWMARLGQEASSTALWKVGEELMDSGDIQGAIRDFEKAQEQDKDAGIVDVDGLLLLGNAYEAAGETQKAAELYEQIYTETPSRSEAYINHIRILLASGDNKDKARAADLMRVAYEKTGDNSFYTQRSDLIPAPPEVDVIAGFYETKKYISITSYQGYDVFYTFDENAKLPEGGHLFKDRIFLDEGVYSLRAVAFHDELVSDELHCTYKIIMPSPQTPRSSLAPNTYRQRQRVWLKPGLDNENDDDIVIYYTIDGSAPNADSPKYTGDPFWLPGGRVTLKAVAVNKYNKVSNQLEILYKIEAKPYPKTAYSAESDASNDFRLYVTTMTEFQQNFGPGELAGDVRLADLDTECRRYDYPWGYAVMSKTPKAWVLAEVCTTSDNVIKAPRGTKVGETGNSVIGKFRDMGQVASESGNRGLYETKEGTGKIWVQADGGYIIRYICFTEDSHRWQLEYNVDRNGYVETIDMRYLP